MAKERTFKYDRPMMTGKDIEDWQKYVASVLKKLVGVAPPFKIDKTYGLESRNFSALAFDCSGLNSKVQMKHGVTPEARDALHKAMNNPLPGTKKLRDSKARKDLRAKLKKQWAPNKVHSPVTKVVADSWGWHPGVHDGIDVQAPANTPIFAIAKAKVIDVREGGWWGKAPSGNVSLGDGIVQLELLESVGPLKKGMHIGYGHSEHHTVKKGQIVEAGHVLGKVGLAVTNHVHFMVNSGTTTKGVGTIDPRAILDYCVKNG